MFKVNAQLQGYRCLKIPEMGVWKASYFYPVNGWVDHMLIDMDGRVGFFDAKTTAQDNFMYSLINRGQIDFLRSVGDRVPAGYVVYFRGDTQRVVFFSYSQLMNVQRRGSLAPAEGLDLGGPLNFDIKKIFLDKLPPL